MVNFTYPFLINTIACANNKYFVRGFQDIGFQGFGQMIPLEARKLCIEKGGEIFKPDQEGKTEAMLATFGLNVVC